MPGQSSWLAFRHHVLWKLSLDTRIPLHMVGYSYENEGQLSWKANSCLPSLYLSMGSLSRKVGRMALSIYICSFFWLHTYRCMYMLQIQYRSSHIAMKFLSLPNCSQLDCNNRNHLLPVFFLIPRIYYTAWHRADVTKSLRNEWIRVWNPTSWLKHGNCLFM